jgi:hypothetical protein
VHSPESVTRAFRRRRLALLLAGLLLVPLCCCSRVTETPAFIWSVFRDDREYPRIHDPLHITVGDGDLEEDLLPHFQVELPCDVSGLRYGEWEDFSTPGTLYLRFEASAACVDEFIVANGLRVNEPTSVPRGVPEEYGWTLAADNVSYGADRSDRVRLFASVDRHAPMPTVYVVADHR